MQGSFSYKLTAEDGFEGCDSGNNVVDMSRNGIMTGTLLGSIVIFIPISRYHSFESRALIYFFLPFPNLKKDFH